MRDQAGENGENAGSESGGRAPRRPLRGEIGKRREKKKQRPSSEVLTRKRTKESGSHAPAPEKKFKRGSPEERLRE